MKIILAISTFLLLTACKGGLPPNTVPAAVAGVELAICVANVAEKGYSAHENEGQIIADCIEQCGTDAATVTRILDANTKLYMAERAAGVAK